MCTAKCIIEKLGSLAFDEVIKAGKYVLQYTKNLGKLQDKNSELGARMKIIDTDVRKANYRGEEVWEDVLLWQTVADRLEDDIAQLIAKSGKANIICRSSLSQEAEEKTAEAEELIKRSHQFQEIAHPKPRPSEFESLSDENYVKLDSRASIFKEIMEKLKYSSSAIIGVYGPGGVGKTTLVKEVAEQMRQDRTFDQVALVVLSKDLNVKEVQTKLAGSLNLKFEATADEQVERAAELWHKFTNGNKYLVILDNIWGMVNLKENLKEIGIPILNGKRGCKVVLTSRMKALLKEANITFEIAKLLEPEAWELFKKKVGNSILSQPEIYSLARDVCRKCAGLPLALNAVGAALQDKPKHAWNNALDKLNESMFPHIVGIDPSVAASLRVSYDMLGSDEQSCFLLCCLFAEDSEIPIDELMRHCMARCLLTQNLHTLDEARNAVSTVVDALKSYSLLTTGSHENVVKIHGVLRSVGITIARAEKAFLIDHHASRWPQNAPSYSVISLNFKHIKELPDELVYPQLHTLMVDNSLLSDLEVPDNFFSEMTQLTVLTFTRMSMRQLPSSLAKLKNLRMLYLIGCKLEDIARLKDLESNLEMLSLQGSSIKALPLVIKQLTNLRLLDLRDCDDLMVIPRGIISSMTEIEELYFPEGFGKWEATTHEKQYPSSSSNNVSLKDIGSLLSTGKLTTLHIHVPNVMLLPMESLKFENLKRFRISVGSSFKPSENFPGTKVLKHKGCSLRNEFIPLVDKADVLCLSGMRGLKKTLHDRAVGNGFLDLKYLKVESSDDDLKYLFGEPKSSMQHHRPFNKLAVLVIIDCKSKYLFSPTSAREFDHLERLIVRKCEMMEAIVGFEAPDDESELTCEVKFSKLKRLELTCLPNLISMYAKKERTTIESSSARVQPLFNEKVILPVLEIFKVEALDSIEEIWDKQSPSVGEKTVSFGQLRNLTVKGCKKLMNLVPSNLLPRMQNLRTLLVQGCPDIEFVVFKNKKEAAVDSTKINIPQLRYLEISHMTNLKSFYSSSTTSNAQSLFNHQVLLPVLEIFKVEALDSIKEIWDKQSPWVGEDKQSHLVGEDKQSPKNEDKQSPLVGEDKQSPKNEDKQSPLVGEKTVSFGQLKNLTVRRCKKLMSLAPSNILSRMENLRTLLVQGCPDMEFVVVKNGKEKQEVAEDSTLIISPYMRRLVISNMENLKSFYSDSATSNAQSLFNHQMAAKSWPLSLKDRKKLKKEIAEDAESSKIDGGRESNFVGGGRVSSATVESSFDLVQLKNEVFQLVRRFYASKDMGDLLRQVMYGEPKLECIIQIGEKVEEDMAVESALVDEGALGSSEGWSFNPHLEDSYST